MHTLIAQGFTQLNSLKGPKKKSRGFPHVAKNGFSTAIGTSYPSAVSCRQTKTKTNVRWSKDSAAGAKKTDLPLFLMVECSAGTCRHLVILPMYQKRSSVTFAIDMLEKEKMLFRTSESPAFSLCICPQSIIFAAGDS